MNEDLVKRLCNECLAKYESIPNGSKPKSNQWTVLSAIVKLDSNMKNIAVVSLGTGSKCIGRSKLSKHGDILNDSHAEVFARRGFLLYLYDQIEKALMDNPSIFIRQHNKFVLREKFEFALFSSQLPCGDASIVQKFEDEDSGDIIPALKKRKLEESDIHRTGAKCLPECEQDAKLPGIMYHTLGQVRYKPGRGDPTLSVSCSDKIARWNYVGIQGALLDMLLSEPIFIKHFIFGRCVPYCEASLKRALVTRDNSKSCDYLSCEPKFYQSDIRFPGARDIDDKRPSAESIVWVNFKPPITEVAIQGKRLGTTKKNQNSEKSRLSICRRNLFKKFLCLVKSDENLKKELIPTATEEVSYASMKEKSKFYYERWNKVKHEVFGTWTSKPKYLSDFSVC